MSRVALFSALALLTLVPLTLAQTASQSTPDPSCTRGLSTRGACCPPECGQCGGRACGSRGSELRSNCCPNSILRSSRVCTSTGPPCRIVGFSPSPSPIQKADPQCSSGLLVQGACCKTSCSKCGGPGCGVRGRDAGTWCCPGQVKRTSRSCATFGPPCVVSGTPKSTPTIVPTGTPTDKIQLSSTNGRWVTSTVTKGSLTKRHEACSVMTNGLVILIGGRGKNKAVSVYDPKTGEWQNRPGPGKGIELHHMQCVAYQGRVYIPSSWTGSYPFEKNSDKAYMYDVAKRQWSTLPALPKWRQRGGAAAVLRKGTIYVVGGNRGGHGGHATTLGWMDSYDIEKKTWKVNMKSMPEGRDHTGGALVGDEICVAGGRDGGVRRFFSANVASTWCYNVGENRWARKADMPAPRAGSSVGKTCDDGLIIAGGEGNGVAYRRVDVFDGSVWKRAPDMVQARHGSGVAVADCACGEMFVASGSGRQGGAPELLTTERWLPVGKGSCAR